mmetsp:Transcript_7957/g.49133  ORF Transcript_7957/g.49133 Transcript_7957/m.49133 type:complete len:84 (+) Transcript_7957:329-580(+)
MRTQQYTSVKPAGDRVFVKLGAEEELSTGGILLPSTAQKKPSEGSVVAVAAEDATVKVRGALRRCTCGIVLDVSLPLERTTHR